MFQWKTTNVKCLEMMMMVMMMMMMMMMMLMMMMVRFLVWLTDEWRVALFPAETIVRDNKKYFILFHFFPPFKI